MMLLNLPLRRVTGPSVSLVGETDLAGAEEEKREARDMDPELSGPNFVSNKRSYGSITVIHFSFIHSTMACAMAEWRRRPDKHEYIFYGIESIFRAASLETSDFPLRQ
jgi:hypothetical protein